MKPPFEYRAKQVTRVTKPVQAPKPVAPKAADKPEPVDVRGFGAKPDYITYRRNRAKWNAYMRAYRAKQKAAKA